MLCENPLVGSIQILGWLVLDGPCCNYDDTVFNLLPFTVAVQSCLKVSNVTLDVTYFRVLVNVNLFVFHHLSDN